MPEPRGLADDRDRPIPKQPTELEIAADARGTTTIDTEGDEVESLPGQTAGLGALGQLVAALFTVALLASLLVGSAALVSWLFR